ncbi:YjcG family protein [Virgibacillus sp. 179-BFC.A HS]|uniref:Putative phosphoesterase P5G51_012825 n=1 Tax=Tigheibacillus jepli TaxID=3035914 RepID=A0ABU5CK10_9BACI|nr:YjcG family protein [Virgibacillus sp. 179-BFC.A HS]MDY0406154.1 YjcG family protein [Virgibacillus sp. 179-BFC.A HS]
MKYGIAYFPNKKIQDEVNSYRKRYDSHYALIPPHLTLKDAFEADDETIKILVPELKKIANETEPFSITINKVSTFAPISNTIYLKVNPSQELQTLYDKLHSGKFSNEAVHPFVPHITLAQDLVDQEYSDVFGSLKMKRFDLADEVDRFQLLYQLDNNSWTVYETFVFGKEFI